jgi:hypothetical protein
VCRVCSSIAGICDTMLRDRKIDYQESLELSDINGNTYGAFVFIPSFRLMSCRTYQHIFFPETQNQK